MWSYDPALDEIVRHFERLATDEIAAGMAQLHVAVSQLGRINSVSLPNSKQLETQRQVVGPRFSEITTFGPPGTQTSGSEPLN